MELKHRSKSFIELETNEFVNSNQFLKQMDL
jgi:hypothetical protein